MMIRLTFTVFRNNVNQLVFVIKTLCFLNGRSEIITCYVGKRQAAIG